MFVWKQSAPRTVHYVSIQYAPNELCTLFDVGACKGHEETASMSPSTCAVQTCKHISMHALMMSASELASCRCAIKPCVSLQCRCVCTSSHVRQSFLHPLAQPPCEWSAPINEHYGLATLVCVFKLLSICCCSAQHTGLHLP